MLCLCGREQSPHEDIYYEEGRLRKIREVLWKETRKIRGKRRRKRRKGEGKMEIRKRNFVTRIVIPLGLPLHARPPLDEGFLCYL